MRLVNTLWFYHYQGVFFTLIFLLFSQLLFPIKLHALKRRKHRLHHHVSPWLANNPINFSKIEMKFFDETDFSKNDDSVIWERPATNTFTELILSWNALRPSHGTLTFWVNIKYGSASWSGWQRMAEWGDRIQRSFTNKNNPYVHTKHVRVEMQHGLLGKGFKVKVTNSGGANQKNLTALFACLCNLKKFKLVKPPSSLPPTFIRGVPKQSQMVLDHPRFRDLCSPTSTSILVNYFMAKEHGQSLYQPLEDYVVDFANHVHDRGKLNIYGNWQLNVAQAFSAAKGDVFFRVERLNGFADLHAYLMKKIPVAVSVRHLRGGATPYQNGHFIVVVGWNQQKQQVLCIDPAFDTTRQTLRAYKLWDFIQAWGRSVNLSYIPMPRDLY